MRTFFPELPSMPTMLSTIAFKSSFTAYFCSKALNPFAEETTWLSSFWAQALNRTTAREKDRFLKIMGDFKILPYVSLEKKLIGTISTSMWFSLAYYLAGWSKMYLHRKSEDGPENL
jgi:hypothetical protein